MTIEPKYQNVVGSDRISLGTTQSIIECKLPYDQNDEIKTVLCVNAKSFIANYEVGAGEVKFSGNVNFQVIYENMQDICNGLDYVAEFSDKFLSDKIHADSAAVVSCSVIDVNTNIVNNEIKVHAIVEISLDVINQTELKALVSIDNENIFVNTDVLEYAEFIGSMEDKFIEMHDVEIKDSVLKVLQVCCSSFVTGVDVNNMYATIRGGANIDICYITNSDNCVMRTHQTKLEFEREIAYEKLLDNSNIQSELNLNTANISVVSNIDSDNAVVNISLPYEFTGYVFNDVNVEIVDDLFSTSNYFNVNTQSFNSVVPKHSIKAEHKVSGGVEEQDINIDQVLGTCGNTITLTSQFVEDSKLIVEGVASTTVLYYNKEFNNTYSMVVEMPFSIQESVHDVDNDSSVVASLSLGEVGAKVRRGRDIEVSATLLIYADIYSSKSDAVISDVIISDEKQASGYALTIYVVKQGQNLWDVAKELNINPDELLEQNPNVELPLQGGEKMVIYRRG